MRKKNKRKGRRPENKGPEKKPAMIMPWERDANAPFPPTMQQQCEDKFAEFKQQQYSHREWYESLYEKDFHMNPIMIHHPAVFAKDDAVDNIDLEIADPVLEWWEQGPLSVEERVEEYLKQWGKLRLVA